MKVILLLIFFPAIAYSNTSIEGRLSLSKTGYEKLKSFMDPQVKIRMDYYIDAFDGNNLILNNAEQPVKLRVKHSLKKTKYQISKVNKSQAHTCGNYFLSVSERETHQNKLEPFQTTRLKDYFKNSLDAIATLENNVLDQLNNFQSFVFSFLQVGTHLLDRELNGKRYILSPTHYTRKSILKKSIVSPDKGSVEFSVRIVTDFDFNNTPFESYEVEFEPEKPELWTPAGLAAFGCSTLKLDQLNSSDVQDTRMDRRNLTLKQLRKIGF